MRRLVAACAVAALVGGCSPAEDAKKNQDQAAAPQVVAGPLAPAKTEAPSGDYTLDKAHSTIVFGVDHISFSTYVGQFAGIDGRLKLDVADPTQSSVEIAIDTKSLVIPAPPAGFLDTLLGDKWLGATAFPSMTFRSTKVELTGADTARVTGDFTLRGITHPVVLEVTFNGGYAGHPYDPHARVGFSARGSLKRSVFGVSEGLPPPGSTMGVGDEVSFEIETEWNGPPFKEAAAQPMTETAP